MKGNNQLQICQAQMMEICQKWVNENIKNPPIVNSVLSIKDGVGEQFVIKLQQTESEGQK